MHIPCPHCGARDLREFSIRGHATGLDRPQGASWSQAWDDYLHNRDNPAGPTEELWHHVGGCGAWLVVERDTATHAVLRARAAREVASDRAEAGA